MKGGGWMGRSLHTGLHFKGFSGLTQQYKEQNGIFNPAAPDYINMLEFENTIFEDIDGGPGFTYFIEPPNKWANVADCGEFPCTGPKNMIMSFKKTKYIGIAPITEKYEDFQLVPDVPGYTSTFKNCVPKKDWNCYLCQNTNLGILLFESLDEDAWDRSMQPIFINANEDAKVSNKLNSFMDHVWDGFYTGQKR